MRVLMISGDPRLFEEGSDAAKRLALQRAQVEQLDAFVWPQIHSLGQIVSAARRTRYDVITAQDPLMRGHLAHHLTQLFGGKLNIQVHMDLHALPWWKYQFAKLQLRNADSIRVVSERIKAQVAALKVHARLTVLPVYIDLGRFRALAATRSHTAQSNTILWIGRFEREKDPLLALEVLKELRAQGVNARLIMLGSGSLEHALKEAAKDLPLVEFPGWRDSRDFLPMASVVLSTSPYESYGASIIEALVAGVPVVTLEVGVAKEAGATVVSRGQLAGALAEALRTGVQGELKLSLPTAEEWAELWRTSLV